MDRLDEIRQRAEAATVPEYPQYSVTASGQVYSIQKWRGTNYRELVQMPDEDGYMCVRLSKNGARRKVRVHRLVAELFLPVRPSPEHQIRHLDGNKNNNSAGNLAWGTAKENAFDRDVCGTTARGAKNGMAKLSDKDILKIRKYIFDGIAQRTVASMFGISQREVGRIAHYEQWKHVG